MPISKVYDGSNFHELIGDGTSIIAGGERRLLSAMPRQAGRLCGAPFRSSIPVIPRSEWSQRIKDQQAKRRRISDFQNFAPHDQNGLPTCWANGPAHAFTTLRVIQGLPLVYMSACSAAVPISGGHSGGNEADAGDYSVKYGWASQSVWANNDTSRSLNSAPTVIESRKHHTAPLILDLNGFDEFATACLLELPFAAAFNWWRHVISGGDLVEPSPGRFGIMFRNNWGDWGDKNDLGFPGYVTMAEGHGTPDSGFAYVQTLASTA